MANGGPTLNPIVFAHRGGAAEAPANTYRAFDNAYDLGVRHIETDVWMADNGELYAQHGATVNSIVNRENPGNIYDLQDTTPKLPSMLARYPAAHFLLDIKHSAAFDRAIDVVHEHEALDRVWFSSSFYGRAIRAAQYAEARNIKIATVLPRLAVISNLLLDDGRRVHESTVAAFPTKRMTTKRMLKHARSNGISVIVQAIESAAEADAFLSRGADGVMTDHPSRMTSLLSDN